MRKKTAILFIMFVCLIIGGNSEAGELSREQVMKLTEAIWRNPASSIDITFYRELKKSMLSEEDARKKAEIVYEPPGDTQTEEEKELEIQKIVKEILDGAKPKFMEARIRIKEHLYRFDQTVITLKTDNQPETRREFTYVNRGNPKEKDYTHFFYDHKSKYATIFNNKHMWSKHEMLDYIGLPKSLRAILRKLLGERAEDNLGVLMPSADKIENLIKGELEDLEISTAKIPAQQSVKLDFVFPKISENVIYSIIVDENDYLKVFNYNAFDLETGILLSERKCDNFNSDNYPQQIQLSEYDRKGNLKKEEKVGVMEIMINPSFSPKTFSLEVPSDYTLFDQRVSPTLTIAPLEDEFLLEGLEFDEPEKTLDSPIPTLPRKDRIASGSSIEPEKAMMHTEETADELEPQKQNEVMSSTKKIVGILILTGIIVLAAVGFRAITLYKNRK